MPTLFRMAGSNASGEWGGDQGVGQVELSFGKGRLGLPHLGPGGGARFFILRIRVRGPGGLAAGLALGEIGLGFAKAVTARSASWRDTLPAWARATRGWASAEARASSLLAAC